MLPPIHGKSERLRCTHPSRASKRTSYHYGSMRADATALSKSAPHSGLSNTCRKSLWEPRIRPRPEETRTPRSRTPRQAFLSESGKEPSRFTHPAVSTFPRADRNDECPYGISREPRARTKGSEQSRVSGYGDNGRRGRQVELQRCPRRVCADPLNRVEPDDVLFQIKPAARFAGGQGILRASSVRGPEGCGPAFLPSRSIDALRPFGG